MKRLFLISLLLLASCREEASLPNPVALDPESVGYFCQMNILDHGGPKAQVHLDVYPGKPLFFSQVRDALAYLRMQEKDGQVTATYVTDMGAADWSDPTQAPWILAQSAVYVAGSDKLGGMDQPEMVPFGDAASAAAFIAQHGGQQMTFAEIPDALLTPPETAPTATDAADFSERLKSLSKPQGN